MSQLACEATTPKHAFYYDLQFESDLEQESEKPTAGPAQFAAPWLIFMSGCVWSWVYVLRLLLASDDFCWVDFCMGDVAAWPAAA